MGEALSAPGQPEASPRPAAEVEEFLLAVAAGAVTLDELLASPPGGGKLDDRRAQELLGRWRHLFAEGDSIALRRRLAWDGLDEAAVAAALAGPTNPPVPPYLATLPEILALSPPSPLPEPIAPVPFGAVLAPWWEYARRRLHRLFPRADDFLSPTARCAAEQHLAEQLAALAEGSLFTEFEAFRAARVAPNAPNPPRNALYRAFVTALYGQGLREWLCAYPVVARHLCLLAWQWSENVAELLQRLDADLPLLASQLGVGGGGGPLSELRLGLSDRHHGGRQVALLQWEDGSAVIYKPRDVTLELAWRDLLTWLAAARLPWVPPAPRVLARPSYGWVERVRAGEEAHPAAFARRAGALVCLAWLVGGSDLHEDNLLATAGGPALVDAEALLQPERDDLSAADASILATGLLTYPIVTAKGELVDAGGLVGGGRPAPSVASWEDINTDAMRRISTPAPPRPADNLPRWRGLPFRPTRWGRQLERGFVETYRFCLAHRDGLLAPDGPLQRFVSSRPRLVLRPTESYVRLQRALLSPAYQRSGVERSLALEVLNRVFAKAPSRPRLWGLVAEERTALENLDIPHFTVAATAQTLTTASGEEIPHFIRRSGWQRLHDRLAGLDERQLARHRRLLRLCVTTQPLADEGYRASPEEMGRAIAAWRQALLTRAERGGTTLYRQVFAASRTPRLAVFAPANPYHLYHGLPGIALAFAALARLTGKRRWRDRALATWSAMATSPAHGDQPLGGCEGVGGQLYALALLAALLGESELRRDLGHRLAGLTPRSIAADARLDVAGGAAGAILGLIAAFQVFGEQHTVEIALACAHHLLHRQGSNGGWHPRATAAPGFAHGAAGIACALSRLGALTGEGPLFTAARRGFDFEASLYDARRGDWRVPARSPSGHTHLSMCAWCNGAAGVALGLATAALPPGELPRLSEALAVTRRVGVSGLDHLCCGSLGVIDVLLTCGEGLEAETLQRAATARGAVVVRRAEGNGEFALAREGTTSAARLGLFHGLAGVVWALVRLATPAQVPSLLAFLTPPRGTP